MQAEILAPAAVLIAWSLVVLLWMAVTRIPAISKAGIDLSKSKPGGRGQDLEGVLPDKVNWKAHNYTHLMEQPTLFYAASMILAIIGTSENDVWAAWAYVAIRIVHSLWQGLVNIVPVRMLLFLVSTACLMWLSISAVSRTLFA